jgi:hypothetical protein
MILSSIAQSLPGMTHVLAPHITLPLASIMAPLAGPGNAPTTIPSGTNTNPFQDLAALVTFLQSFIFWMGLTVFLIGVAIAGIMRMVAFGSERRIATSNIALTAAVVGLVIMLLGSALLSALTTVFPQ